VADEEYKTVWCTKYALTKGIFSAEVRAGPNGWEERYVYTKPPYSAQFIMDRTAWYTEEEAKVAARKMRDNKVASLRKMIKKLQEMEF
jgi:hypothetical protein